MASSSCFSLHARLRPGSSTQVVQTSLTGSPGRCRSTSRCAAALVHRCACVRAVLGARAASQPKRGRQDSTGLGNGITFALDPQLCPNLLPTFKEESQATDK
eukprot:scaffold84078_cov48-Phaeocystis_antarctica.AAC.2